MAGMMLPKLKSAESLGGVKSPKMGQGSGIPHISSGSLGKPKAPLQLERGDIKGFRAGGQVPRKMMTRPMPGQQQQRPNQPPPMGMTGQQPVNPYQGVLGMRRGGPVPGYSQGGPVMPRMRKPMPAVSATASRMPGAGGLAAPMGLRNGGMVDTKKKAIPPGTRANKKAKKMKTAKKAAKKGKKR